MLLRSSSTPVLGSLLSSISPEISHHHHHQNHHDTTIHPYKSSFQRNPSSGSHHFITLSCNSSPISPSVYNMMRRSQSEGNLESLMNSGGGGDDAPKKLSSRLPCSLLETIPSFSNHNSRFKSDGDESGDDEEHEEADDGLCEFRGDCGAAGSGGGGRNVTPVGGGEEGGGGGGDNRDVEEHYKKVVHESPGNPLLLGNYARFLYQSKQDLQGAEEYYSRAILIDSNDGEILSQYAKVLWELHRDKKRAASYFERAIQTASENSHVHASYASFLWEIEEEEDEDEEGYFSNIPPFFNNATIAFTATP